MKKGLKTSTETRKRLECIDIVNDLSKELSNNEYLGLVETWIHEGSNLYFVKHTNKNYFWRIAIKQLAKYKQNNTRCMINDKALFSIKR